MEPTEEEIAAFLEAYALQQRGSVNPLAFTANQYGQGPGFLGLEDKPDSWKRAGDKNEIMRDILGVTDIDFAELVPGLFPNIQAPKPGDIDPVTQLYANDPAVQYIAQLVNDPVNPVSPTQAVNALRSLQETDPELFAELSGSIPMSDRTDNYGNTSSSQDWDALAKTAEDYLAAGSNDQQALYDDYVRGRSVYEKAEDSGKDLSYDARRKAVADAMGYGNYERTEQPLQAAPVVPGVAPIVTRPASRNMDDAMLQANQYVMDNPGRSPQRNPLAGTRATRGRGSAPQATASPTPRGEWAQPKDTQRELNVRSASDAATRIMKSKQAESKKEENLSRIIAAYNTYIYGQ